MELQLTIKINIFGHVGDTEEEKLWFENEILVGDGSLLLHSNEIGDTIGEIKKVSNIKWID